MKQVTRYQCEWCGKEFKTPDRHKCRWDPCAHNCLSCRHRGKSVEELLEDSTRWLAFECPFNEDICESPSDFSKGAVASEGNDCPHWEILDGYKGKESFAEIERDRLLKGEYNAEIEKEYKPF